jgi:hypothetical protein
MGTRWLSLLTLLLLSGCKDDSTSVRDLTPPAAPRGVYTVTGDGEVVVHWLANTERDVAGYRIYQAPCETGSSCPYDRVGSTTAASFAITGLSVGWPVLRGHAYDHAGNEATFPTRCCSIRRARKDSAVAQQLPRHSRRERLRLLGLRDARLG